VPQKRPELRRGRIIWATIRDHNGVPKQRPLIVITATDDIRSDEPFEVMAVSTTFPDPPPDECVLLPWHPTGKSITGLRRRSAAVTDWIDAIRPTDVVEYGADVPPTIMFDILDRL
jgi:hypothetical protein